MAVAKVALSLQASLLARIDRHAKKSSLSRSAFVPEVMERTLRQPHEDEILRKARHLHAEAGEEDRVLSDGFLTLAAETLPSRPTRGDARWSPRGGAGSPALRSSKSN